MSATFELKSHTADVAIEATAPTLEGVFEAAGDGLAAAHVEELPVGDGSTVSLDVRAESKTALLFDYLDRLIYVRDVEDVLPVDNTVTIHHENDEWILEGTATGIPTSELAAREVKAITYSEMKLEERNGQFYAYVVVDV